MVHQKGESNRRLRIIWSGIMGTKFDVDEIWHIWENFARDVCQTNNEGLFLVKNCPDFPIGPENFSWVEDFERTNRRRKWKIVTYRGKSFRLWDLSQEFGLDFWEVFSHLRNGRFDFESFLHKKNTPFRDEILSMEVPEWRVEFEKIKRCKNKLFEFNGEIRTLSEIALISGQNVNKVKKSLIESRGFAHVGNETG